MSIIKVKNLSKNFGDVAALQDFSLDIEKGQVVGLLGPNGAGKSTLIKTLVGGVKPTSGSVEVFGMEPLKHRKELAHRFGYMPQEASLYEDLSVKENVSFFAKLHRQKSPGQAIDEVLDFLDMGHKKHERVQHLSGGMKTRVSLACAMIYEPDVLFLDEPTAGLDPVLKRSLWEMFKNQASQGKTLFISTHLMEEALLCDELAIIQHGRLVTAGTPGQIVARGDITVKLKKGQEKIEQTLPSDPKQLASFLSRYGLDKEIEAVDIVKESLEDVTIKLLEGEDKS